MCKYQFLPPVYLYLSLFSNSGRRVPNSVVKHYSKSSKEDETSNSINSLPPPFHPNQPKATVSFLGLLEKKTSMLQSKSFVRKTKQGKVVKVHFPTLTLLLLLLFLNPNPNFLMFCFKYMSQFHLGLLLFVVGC